MEERAFPAGATVLRQGNVSSDFYVIAAGAAGVQTAAEGVVLTLREGDYFGEEAIIATGEASHLRHDPRR